MADPIDPNAPAPLVRGKFYTGARPSPRLKLMMARPHRVLKTPPAQFAMIPKQLAMWGNDEYGDCVSAEEAFAKAAWSVACNLPELFTTNAEVVAWARKHGFLNGADLTSVMDAMSSSGMSIGGTIYKDGGYTAVDYSDEVNLQSAIASGPVKIAIDHSALPEAAGNQNGWIGLGGNRKYNDTDHCVGITGYGPAGWLAQQLGVPLPGGVVATTFLYLVPTWGTIGFVDHKWLVSTTSEAWLRTPTTPGQTPAPTPSPSPTPTPSPSPSPTFDGKFSVQVDGVNKIATLTPPDGYEGEIDPPPYQP